MKIVITGGTKGIGWAIAEHFAKAGHDIALCARTAGDLDKRKSYLNQHYPSIKVLTKVVDMSNKAEVIGFGDDLLQEWSSIDVLINNAGVFLPGEIHKEADGVLENQIQTNLYSAYHMTRALVPNMLDRKAGHIFNMCSVASLIAYPNGGSYSISKFALLGFSKALREELKDKGIKVTSIMPGATWSDSWAGVELPEDRLMQAEDIAIAVLAATQMSPSAVIEDIVLRPQLGDL